MAKTRKKKVNIVDNLAKKFEAASLMVFYNFEKIKVKETENLKKELRSQNIHQEVVKKNLLELALKKAKFSVPSFPKISGTLALALGVDEILPAKILGKFKQEHKEVKFLGGILYKEWLEPGKVEELSKLPSKVELLSALVRQIQAPISGFVNVLSGNLRKIVYVLEAIKNSKS